MIYLLIAAQVVLNLFYVYTFYYAPLDFYEAKNIDQTQITWERDPAFVASMTKLTDSKALNIREHDGSTIIHHIPQTNAELMTFGHECLHAFGYSHP